jgi:hypothetical protein
VLKNLCPGKTETCRETNFTRDKCTAENVQQKRHMEAYIQKASRQTGYRKKRRHKFRDIRVQLSMWSRHRYK